MLVESCLELWFRCWPSCTSSELFEVLTSALSVLALLFRSLWVFSSLGGGDTDGALVMLIGKYSASAAATVFGESFGWDTGLGLLPFSFAVDVSEKKKWELLIPILTEYTPPPHTHTLYIYIYILESYIYTFCKQWRSWSDVAFCGVWYGSTLFVNYTCK